MSDIRFKGFFVKSNTVSWKTVVRVWYPIKDLGLLDGEDDHCIEFTESEWETLKRTRSSIVEHVMMMDYYQFCGKQTGIVQSFATLDFKSVDPSLRIKSFYRNQKDTYYIGNPIVFLCYHREAMLWIFERSDEIDAAFEKIKQYQTERGPTAFLQERERVDLYLQRIQIVGDMYWIYRTDRSDPRVLQYIEEMKGYFTELETAYKNRDVVYADLLKAFCEFNWHCDMMLVNTTSLSFFPFMMSQKDNWKFVRYAAFDLLASRSYSTVDHMNGDNSDEMIRQHMETMRMFVESFLEWDDRDLLRYLDHNMIGTPMRVKLVYNFKRYIIYLDIPRWKSLYDSCMKRSGGFNELAVILECFVPLSLQDVVNERYVVDRPILLSDIDRIVAYANAIDDQDEWIWIYILRIFYYIDIKGIDLGNKRPIVHESIRRILRFFNPIIRSNLDRFPLSGIIDRAIY